MAKQETFISEEQANWRMARFVLGAAFWMALGAFPAWHFATEHSQLQAYQEKQDIQALAMNSLSNSIPVSNHLADAVIAKAAKGK